MSGRNNGAQWAPGRDVSSPGARYVTNSEASGDASGRWSGAGRRASELLGLRAAGSPGRGVAGSPDERAARRPTAAQPARATGDRSIAIAITWRNESDHTRSA